MDVASRLDALEAALEDARASPRRDATADDDAVADDDDPGIPAPVLSILREGLGPTLALYVDARRAEHRFTESEYARLEAAMNGWLDLYTRQYGVEATASFAVREAAELFVQTHNVRDVAQLLTGVPRRHAVAE